MRADVVVDPKRSSAKDLTYPTHLLAGVGGGDDDDPCFYERYVTTGLFIPHTPSNKHVRVIVVIG